MSEEMSQDAPSMTSNSSTTDSGTTEKNGKKRKYPEDRKEKPLTKLFVRNLIEATTNEDLDSYFRKFGTLRRSFIATKQGDSNCIGYGFIQFANHEEAKEAIKKTHGKTWKGKTLWVEFAKPRDREEEFQEKYTTKRIRSRQAKLKKGSQQGEQTSSDGSSILMTPSSEGGPILTTPSSEGSSILTTPSETTKETKLHDKPTVKKRNKSDFNVESLRSLIVVGIPTSFQTVTLKKSAEELVLHTQLLSKKDKHEEEEVVETVNFPMPGSVSTEPIAEIIFKDEKSANKALRQISKIQLKERQLIKEKQEASRNNSVIIANSLKGKKKQDYKKKKGGLIKILQIWASQTLKYTIRATSRKEARLIVRNLNFTMTQDDLKVRIKQQVENKNLEINNNNSDSKNNKQEIVTLSVLSVDVLKGFGFIELLNREQAQKAIELLNGVFVRGRPIAVDWSLSKNSYLKALENPANIPTVKQEQAVKTEPEIKQEEIEQKIKEEKKNDRNKKEAAKNKEKQTTEKEEKVDKNNRERIEKLKSQKDKIDKKIQKVEEEEQKKRSRKEQTEDNKAPNNEDAEEEETEIKLEKDIKEEKKGEEEGKNKNMKKKPKDDYKCIVFIRNLPYDATESDLISTFSPYGTVKLAKLVISPQTGTPSGTAFLHFTSATPANYLLTLHSPNNIPNSNTNLTPPLTINGRNLILLPALPPQSLNRAITNRQQAKEAGDNAGVRKRNLQLQWEGLIKEGMEAYDTLSDKDKQMRNKLFQLKRDKLKNPNHFMSSTRLSIHNLPKFVDEKKMKQICGEEGRVKQMIIVKEKKNGKSTGAEQGRGFGFVEYEKEQDALKALRRWNNSTEMFGGKNKLIIEFAVENGFIVDSRLKKQQQLSSSSSSDKTNNNNNRKRKREQQDDNGDINGDEGNDNNDNNNNNKGKGKGKGKNNKQQQGVIDEEETRQQKKRRKLKEKGERAQLLRQEKKQSANYNQLVSDYKSSLFGGSKISNKSPTTSTSTSTSTSTRKSSTSMDIDNTGSSSSLPWGQKDLSKRWFE